MNLKSIFIVLLAALLALASCDGGMDAPGQNVPGVSHPDSDIPVIDVPSGEEIGTPGNINDFIVKYDEKNAAAYGVYIISERTYTQNIKPKYMVAYEAEYNEIYNSYYENKRALDEQRAAGTISVEKYFEESYRLQNERDTANFELAEKWKSLNVWSPYMVNTRIVNSSDSDHTFQYVIFYKNSWSDDGICYMSEPVTLAADSDAIYTFEVNTGGKYMDRLWLGYNVY